MISSWFPVGRNDPPGWRLDAVGLLAVLGESLMATHVQVLCASRLCMLPRLIPAPHVFLKSGRMLRLPCPPAIIVGVHSGIQVRELNYFANIIHPIGHIMPYEVIVYDIRWTGINRDIKSWNKPVSTDASLSSSSSGYKGRTMIPPSRWSPLNILTVISSMITVGVLIAAILIHDGVAVLAIITMSLATAFVGIASHWRPQLSARTSETRVHEGNMVIRTREGSFIIVRCSEEIARELYTGAEECNYLMNEQWFRILTGVSTILVMISVLLLGNCNWEMQAVIAVTYMVLNGLYWAISLLPKKWFWDLSRYEWRDITPDHYRDAAASEHSYTRSLWYAIQATGDIAWVTSSGAAPKGKLWKDWLKSAYANRQNPKWDAVAEKDRLFSGEYSENKSQIEEPTILPVRRETV